MTRSVLRAWARAGGPPAAFAVAVAVVAVEPHALVPVARAINAVCRQLPGLSALTGHLPPLVLAFLAVLGAVMLAEACRIGLAGFVATARFNRATDRRAQQAPVRLEGVGRRLGIDHRLTFLADPAPLAFCYGFFAPRIAVSAGLLTLLDDAELLAVVAHEREHLRQRDPLRYLFLDVVAAATFALPIAGALRARIEARIELAADQAALAVAPRAALAGAMLAVIAASTPSAPGLAGLSATEARIASLSGRLVLPPLPIRAVAASAAIGIVVTVTGTSLALSIHNLAATCVRCTGG